MAVKKKKVVKKKPAAKKKVAKKKPAAKKKVVKKKPAAKKKVVKKKPAAKKKVAKKKPAAKKKVAKKKPAAKKKVAKKKPAAKKKVAKKKPAAKKKVVNKKPAAKKKVAKKKPAAKKNEVSNAPTAPVRTSLPEDHEVLFDVSELPAQKVDKQVAIEAIRAAFQAEKENPVRGKEHFGARSRQEIPVKGEIDYAHAQAAQRAAQEVIAADSAARARDADTEQRIAAALNEEQSSDS